MPAEADGLDARGSWRQRSQAPRASRLVLLLRVHMAKNAEISRGVSAAPGSLNLPRRHFQKCLKMRNSCGEPQSQGRPWVRRVWQYRLPPKRVSATLLTHCERV